MHKRLDPRLGLAVRDLPVDCIADVWRALRPVANELGLRPPSYNATVALVHGERERRCALADVRRANDEVVGALIAGRVPSWEQLERLEAAVQRLEAA